MVSLARNARQLISYGGYTLVEVLLALGMGALLMAAMMTAVMQGYSSSRGVQQRISVQEDVRATLEVMAAEISMASFNRISTFTGWTKPDCATNCSSAPDTCSRKGILNATGNILTVAMNITENALPGDPNEIITYSYDTNSQMITRSTNCAGAMPFLGGSTASSDEARNVRVINNEVGVPIFTYYDGSGLEISAAGMPTADYARIQRIKITLIVTSLVSNLQGDQRTMTYSTSVIPRNHAI